jgi:hypothetical protein
MLEELFEDRADDRIFGVLGPYAEKDVHELAHQRRIESRLVDADNGAEGLEEESEDFVAGLGDERHEIGQNPMRERLDGRWVEMTAETGKRKERGETKEMSRAAKG